ncbi:MAG: hypothetical protein RSD85_04645 [Erysipelotrichaceae bacterium]
MKEYMKHYIEGIDILIKDKSVNEDSIRLHREKISEFQHERLIHLIVTVLFALLTMGMFIMVMIIPSKMIFILLFMFIGLLIPYIKHYYYLENSVQYTYKQYDKMIEIYNERRISNEKTNN